MSTEGLGHDLGTNDMTTTDAPSTPAIHPIDLAPWLPGTRRARLRWAVRSHAAEVLLAGMALFVNAWALGQNDLGNPYYAAAARSMTTSWRNFVFASYDPGGWITNDKPPLAMWIQAVWVKVFGLNSWSMLLPSAIAGALSVLLVVTMVRRVWGRTAGLAAGVALALTPAMFAVSRSSNPDAVLVFFIVLAAWSTQRAIDSSRTPSPGRRPAQWMTATGAFIGLAFLTKMLVAMVVVPAIAAAYLLAGGLGWRRRLLHSGYLAGAFVVVSGAWIALMDLTSSSPWVGGSDDGSAWDLVFGYNGFGRVFGNSGPGGAPGGGRGPGVGAGPGMGIGGVDQFGGSPGIGRLFNSGMGDQVMWLFVVAAGALVGTSIWLWLRRRDASTRAQLGSLLLFGVWAITAYALFAGAEGVFHNYYVSALAPALAGLVGIGVGVVLRSGRTPHLVAAVLLAATAAVQVVFINRIDTFGWLKVVVPVLIGVVALGLLLSAMRTNTSHAVRTVLATGAIGALSLAPAVWVWGGMHQPQNASFPDARPANSQLVSTGGIGNFPGTNGLGGGRGRGDASTAVLDYLENETTTERWILAVASSMQANQAIIDGYSVMAMGGFSGGDAAMTVGRLADLVESGELRFVSADAGRGPGGGRGGPGGGPGGGANSQITAAVTAACTPLGATVTLAGVDGIYDCRGAAAALRNADTSIPADVNTSTPVDTVTDTGTGRPDGDRPIGPDGDFDPSELFECLEAQGYDPRQGPPDESNPAERAALEACAQFLPDGGTRPGGGRGPGGGPPN